MYEESGPQSRLHFQYHMYGAEMGSPGVVPFKIPMPRETSVIFLHICHFHCVFFSFGLVHLFEASGNPNKASSYLVSPMYAESGSHCGLSTMYIESGQQRRLHFQYYMFGADMGSLGAVLKH